jgi:hypothetical protein
MEARPRSGLMTRIPILNSLRAIKIQTIRQRGKYEIAVQSDKFQINGRNATNSGFVTIMVVQRLAAGREYWLSDKQPIWRGARRHRDC